jgi:D-alanine transfer protein
MPHLFAGVVALALAGISLFACERIVVHLERTTIHATAPELFSLKNQGLAFQRAAAHAHDVLPIYGSSELRVPEATERGNNFFRTAPTGFQLSPVGSGGANPLIMLQKIGALGSHLRGKKVAISLSPGWFLTATPSWQGYNANFSFMAAIEMLFGNALDFDLKRRIASRMLEYPSTFENRPLLEFALRRLASNRWFDHMGFYAVCPAGRAQIALLELEDHLGALHHIRHDKNPAPLLRAEIPDWPALIAKASHAKAPDVGKAPKLSIFDRQITPGSRDVGFRKGVQASPIWIDLELLLRTFAAVGARPIILSMPIAGDFYDHAGVSRSAREEYYAKLRALVQRYGFAVAEFEDHDEDPVFLIKHQSHLTAKGWVFYDRALDDFFHGRAPARDNVMIFRSFNEQHELAVARK